MGTKQGGRRPRPTRLRLLDGARPSKTNQHEPVPRPGVLEAPESMSDDVRFIWDFTVAQLVHMGIDAPSDRDALVAYCEAVDKHRKASILLARSPLMIVGQKGNLVRNPALMVQRDAAHLIRQFAQEFGLTPSARTRIDAERQNTHDVDNPFAL
jgi:P27 family predicted phage terminase small subunit